MRGTKRWMAPRIVSAPRNTVSSSPRALRRRSDEDVAALGIGAELDLVDGEERGAEVERHRLDRADEILGVGRNDLLLAGDECRGARALQPHDLVVDLARQKAQRQPDHAGFVRQHPLDREMRLAGVGGAEDGGDFGRCVHRLNIEFRRAHCKVAIWVAGLIDLVPNIPEPHQALLVFVPEHQPDGPKGGSQRQRRFFPKPSTPR